MILVMDAGNTNIVLGVYRDDKLIVDWRLSTDLKRTSDEYGAIITDLLTEADSTQPMSKA